MVLQVHARSWLCIYSYPNGWTFYFGVLDDLFLKNISLPMHRFQLGGRGGAERGSTHDNMYVDLYLPTIWRHVAYEHKYSLGSGLWFSHELPAYLIVDWGGSSM